MVSTRTQRGIPVQNLFRQHFDVVQQRRRSIASCRWHLRAAPAWCSPPSRGATALRSLQSVLDCKTRPRASTHYEQNKSGAVLVWEWAHRTAAPWLLQYVQDKDLHRWQLPESRAINAAIESYPFDFDVWSGLKRYELATEGRAILRA